MINSGDGMGPRPTVQPARPTLDMTTLTMRAVPGHFIVTGPAHAFPGVPALPKLSLGLLHTIGVRHRTGDGERPEPAQAIGTSAGLIDPADRQSPL
jgi:hypothetical protein